MLDFESFYLAFQATLDRFAPLKQEVVRNNNQSFMTETLRKAIMKRSKLRKKFNTERNAKNWSNYKQQRKCYSNLLKKSKTRHFNNLDVKDATQSKRLWKTMKPLFTDKTKNSNNIILFENYHKER